MKYWILGVMSGIGLLWGCKSSSAPDYHKIHNDRENWILVWNEEFDYTVPYVYG